MRTGKASTIVLTILISILTLNAIMLYFFDFKLALDAARSIEDADHYSEAMVFGLISFYGLAGVIFGIFLLIIVFFPAIIMLIFTIHNRKSPLTWVKVMNIIYDLILVGCCALAIIKLVFFITYL